MSFRSCVVFMATTLSLASVGALAQNDAIVDEPAGDPPQTFALSPYQVELMKNAGNPNGGFEEEGVEGAAGWLLEERNGAQWTPVSGSDRSHGGERCITLAGTGGKHTWIRAYSNSIAVQSGDTLDIELWANRTGPRPKNPLTAFLEGNIDGKWTALEGRIVMKALKAWQPAKITACIIPRGVSEVRLLIYASSAEAEGSAWYVDDVSVRVTSFRDYVARNKGQKRLPDITLIVSDAQRQDSFSTYGYNGAYTPNLEKLAAEGRVYDEVTSAAAWTRPSFGSLFTSLYPSQHDSINRNNPLPERHITLAETLREQGYFTVGFANTGQDGWLGVDMGFAQGFDAYYMGVNPERVYDAVVDFVEANGDAMREMDGGGIFIFWHAFEPHEPYPNPHPDLIRNEGLMGTVDLPTPLYKKMHTGDVEFNDKDVEYLRALYDWRVNLMDERIGDVLVRLNHTGLYQKMNIIFTSDHGQAFNENGEWGHCHGYESCVRIPLLMRLPGLFEAGGRDSSTLVSNMDIMPTLLELAGAGIPEQCVGRSLLEDAPDAYTAKYGVCEDHSHGWLSLRERQYKIISRYASTRISPTRSRWVMDAPDSPTEYEVYDLDADPAEQHDLAQENPELLQRMREQYDAHRAAMGISYELDTSGELEERAMSEEMENQLRAIGYIE